MRCPEVVVGAVNDITARAGAEGKLNGRIDKPFRYFPPAKGADSAANPHIDLVRTSVQSGLANYFGRYVEHLVRAVPEADFETAAAKFEPCVLVIGSAPYLPQVRAHLVKVGLVPDDADETQDDRDRGLELLHANANSNLGWRIVLAYADEALARAIVQDSAARGVPLCEALTDEFKAAVLQEASELIARRAAAPEKEAANIGAAAPILLTSYEGSKGLSAQHVVLVGLHDGDLPRKPEAITDIEICKFLVGLTRTKKKCAIVAARRFGSDLTAKRGFALIDPHGELADQVRDACGARAIYLDPTDSSQPYGYNPLRRVRDDRIPLAASGLLETFRKLWPDAWGVRMEHVLRNSLYALLERDGSSLPDILRLYADDVFRKAVTSHVRNEVVRAFWKTEFEKYPPRYKLEVTAPIQNKLGAVLADPALRRVVVSPVVDLHFRSLMNEGAVIVANLAKGRLGEDTSSILGSLLVSTIGLAALSRADSDAASRAPFHLYVDEFQAFTTLSFANMMAELRKYGLGLTLAHQHLHQLDPDIRHAVLGNAGTLISFRVGAEDAAFLAQEFQPIFGVEDLINLQNRYFYVKLMIDGSPSWPFSARTLDAAKWGHVS